MKVVLQSVACMCALLPAANAQRDTDAFAVKAARFLTIDTDPVHDGVMLVENGKITAIGVDVEVPQGTRELDFGDATICPGFVDLHHHVSGSMGDINDIGVRNVKKATNLRTVAIAKGSDRQGTSAM